MVAGAFNGNHGAVEANLAGAFVRTDNVKRRRSNDSNSSVATGVAVEVAGKAVGVGGAEVTGVGVEVTETFTIWASRRWLGRTGGGMGRMDLKWGSWGEWQLTHKRARLGPFQ